MSIDPTAPISGTPGGIWLQRAVGVVAVAAGMALALLSAYFFYKASHRQGEIETSIIVVIFVPALLAAFLLTSGVRMLLNHPNAYGSLFSPATWFVAATFFFLGGGLLVSKTLASGAPSVALKPILYAFFFGIVAAWAGWRARRRIRGRSRSAP